MSKISVTTHPKMVSSKEVTDNTRQLSVDRVNDIQNSINALYDGHEQENIGAFQTQIIDLFESYDTNRWATVGATAPTVENNSLKLTHVEAATVTGAKMMVGVSEDTLIVPGQNFIVEMSLKATNTTPGFTIQRKTDTTILTVTVSGTSVSATTENQTVQSVSLAEVDFADGVFIRAYISADTGAVTLWAFWWDATNSVVKQQKLDFTTALTVNAYPDIDSIYLHKEGSDFANTALFKDFKVYTPGVVIEGDEIASGAANHDLLPHFSKYNYFGTLSRKMETVVKGLTANTTMVGGKLVGNSEVKFDDFVTAVGPKMVVLMSGSNDIAADATQSSMQTALQSIMSKCETAETPLLVLEVLPRNDFTANQKTAVSAWNGLLPSLVVNYSYTKLVTCQSLFNDGSGGIRSCFSSDGKNLTPAAYNLLAQRILQAIKEW